ncbi:MAG: IS66 family insertion sequence element accessory protein TnpA [Planctomycetia bacterium]
MGRGVDRRKLAAWRRRLARQDASGLTVTAFCRRERVSVSLWKYWQRQVEREVPIAHGLAPLRPAMPFAAVEIIPRRSVFLRFPGGATMEIPDDRIDLVRLAIDRMAMQGEAGPC